MPFYKRLQQETQSSRDYLLSSPLISRCMQEGISLEEYQAFLTEAYHHVKHTVPLLMAVGSRLTMNQEWLRCAIGEYIEEEMGHQEWVLNDIEACGGDKTPVREGMPCMATELMVAYAYDTIQRKNPIGFFGMVLVLEGTSTRLACGAADRIQEKLSLPDQAFTYLRSHGSLDVAHMQFFERLMNNIHSAEEQESIIHAAHVFYRLYAGIFHVLPMHGCASRALEQTR